MRTSKKVLLAVLAPTTFLVGLASGTAFAGGRIGFPLPQNTCMTVLCSTGSICVDTDDGPICVPNPNGPIDF
jgi:hypothetical protein